jgi:Bacterial Ig domain/Secretion system C-terminal sorting domain
MNISFVSEKYRSVSVAPFVGQPLLLTLMLWLIGWANANAQTCDFAPSTALMLNTAGGNTGATYTNKYVLTNDVGTIQQIQTTPNFTGVAAGMYIAYNVNYETTSGISNLSIGNKINIVTGACAKISAPLTLRVCSGSLPCDFTTNDPITFTASGGNMGASYTNQYILTNDNGVIIAVSNTASFSAQATAGAYLVYNINYLTSAAPTGLTTGANISQVAGTCMQLSAPLGLNICTPVVVNTNIINPDFVVTTINIPVNGNVSTNDIVSVGTTYGLPTPIFGNPTAALPIMNPNGTYSFTTATAGVYQFNVPVCPSGQTTGCPTSLLKITVNGTSTNPPIANPDNATVLVGSNTVINVLGNDGVGTNPINPAATTVTTAPAHGMTSVNPTTGAITYTPTPGYTGADVFTYQVCDNATPTANCATTTVTVDVQPATAANSVNLVDDYATTPYATPVTGNVLANDTDPQGNAIAATAQSVTNANGTFSLAANGNYTFTPNANFPGGPVDVIYQACDNNPTPVCANATLHILVGVPACDFTTFNAITFNAAGGNTTGTFTNQYLLTATTGNIMAISNTASFPMQAAGTYLIYNINYKTSSTPTGMTVGNPVSGITGTCMALSAPIAIKVCPVILNPDFAVTTPGTPVTGNVNTNDDVPPGTTYGTPPVNPSNPSACAPVVASNGTFTFTCSTPGDYVFDVPVCPAGQTTNCPTTSLVITVKNPTGSTTPPVANPDIASVTQGGNVAIPVLANDGAGSNPINVGSVTVPSTGAGSPSHGTVVVSPAGVITYTPSPGFVGDDTFTYTVCDNATPTALCNTATVVVHVLPTTAPNSLTANDDYVNTNYGTNATGSVLTNDTDPQGNTLTASAQNVTTAAGTFVLNTNGTYTFTPATGFSGPTTFKYQVCDNGNPVACDSATLHILVNPKPTVLNPDFAVTTPGSPVTGNVNTNDDVPPGTTYGTPPVNPSNPSACAPVVASNGTFTFTCSTPGDYVFDVPVCPAGQTTNCPTTSLVITVKNPTGSTTPPVANPDIASVTQGGNVAIPVLANDGAGSNPINVGSVTVPSTGAGSPSHGTVVVSPAGVITYTPSPGFVGDDTFTYTVCDNATPTALCKTATVVIHVLPTNAPNSLTANDDYVNTNYGTNATGNVLTNDTDPQGNTLTASAQNVTTAAGTFVLNTNGTYTFTPATGFSGPTTYKYQVCDNGNPVACDSATLHILVEPNLNPSVINPDFNVGNKGTSIIGNLKTNDNIPSGTTYGTPSGAGNPSTDLPVMNPNGSYTFTTNTPGTYTFIVPVCEAGQTSNCPTTVLIITVLDPETVNPPAANIDFARTSVDTNVEIQLLANDRVSNPTSVLNPGSLTITSQPAHGTLIVSSTTGNVTFIPSTSFTGDDEFEYQVCDNTQPTALCSKARTFIKVLPVSTVNTTTALDDYIMIEAGKVATGNVKTNDIDPQGDAQIITAQTITTPAGDFILAADGSYTFTANSSFAGGTVDVPYTVCDVGMPMACVNATLHVLVNPDFCASPRPPVLLALGLDKSLYAFCDDNGWIYYRATRGATTSMMAIHPNGNTTFDPQSVKIDALQSVANAPMTQTGAGNTTTIADRLFHVIAPGTYTVNGGLKVRLYYDVTEFANLPTANRSWFKHIDHTKAGVNTDLTATDLNNAIRLVPATSGTENNTSFVEFHGIQTFSTFGYLGSTSPIALPVKMLYYKQAVDACEVRLDWATASEQNSKSFEVWRSTDGNKTWTKLTTLAAAGNSTVFRAYTFTDTKPNRSNIYKLVQTDFDGKEAIFLSGTMVTNGCFEDTDNGISGLYPNPNSVNELNVKFYTDRNDTENINFVVYDVLGRVVVTYPVTIVRGANVIKLDITNLHSGAYMVKAVGEGWYSLPQKLVRMQ